MSMIKTLEEAAAAIRDHAAAGRIVRPHGGGTKLGWVPQGNNGRPAIDFDTRGLNRILEHNAGDFTAVLEAGVSLAEAQAAFAKHGQMLAIDPPFGAGDGATLGGVLATNDSGPLRHRYGAMRDLVIGVTVVLSDGTTAKSGGQVIKNVAGYDLAKLFTGSYGTLGLIARIAVRLHPKPASTATVLARSNDPDRITAAAVALSKLPLEADSLDVSWSNGSGELLLRFAGSVAKERAHAAASRVALEGVQIVLDDEEIWSRQRARQRGNLVVKVSGRPTDLANVIRAADKLGGTVVSRAGLGLSWIELDHERKVAPLRAALAPRACTVLDGADRSAEPWPDIEPGALALMRRVKERFDPAGAFRPGSFVGGI